MNINIVDKKIKVGTIYYEELHHTLKTQTEMYEIRELIEDFTKKHKDSPHLCGITIHDNTGFVYVIKNKTNGKQYIGQTINLIERMEAYAYASRRKNPTGINKELHKDFLKYGLQDFSISIKMTKKYLDEEKKLIRKTENLYNQILYSEKTKIKRNYKKNQTFELGKKTFKSKTEIKKYNRELLDSSKVGSYYKLDSEVGLFATEIVKYNPSYDKIKGKTVKLMVVKDDFNENRGTGKWNVFCFEWIENEEIKYWVFSTNNSIDNIKSIK